MGSLRRTIIAGTGTIVAGIVGAWSVLSSGNENTENASSMSPQSGGRNASENTSIAGTRDSRTNTSRENVTHQSDLPEAAHPEANPRGPETNDSVIAEPGEVGQTEPTTQDIEISNTKLATSERGAVLTTTVTNTADVAVTVDLEVAVLEDGKRLTTAWGGVTGLKPEKSTDLVIRSRGSEYATVTDYRITKHVQVASRR